MWVMCTVIQLSWLVPRTSDKSHVACDTERVGKQTGTLSQLGTHIQLITMPHQVSPVDDADI